jgi:hypothetical protein
MKPKRSYPHVKKLKKRKKILDTLLKENGFGNVINGLKEESYALFWRIYTGHVSWDQILGKRKRWL